MIAAFLKKHPQFSVFFLCYALFSLAVGGTEVNKIDIRFAYILQDMLQQPFSIFPHINNVPYADYFSPFFYFSFLTTGCGKWVNLWSMAQPAILLASFTLMMTYRIGERLMPKAGSLAVLLMLSAFEYVYSVCQFGIDLPVSALAILMLDQLLLYPDRKRTVGLWMFFIPLAMLFRGSLGVIVFCGAVAGYILMTGNLKKILLYGITGAASAGIGTALIIGLIHWEGGTVLFRHFLDWQIQSRVAGGDIFYYILDGFCCFAPGSFLILAVLILKRKTLKKGLILPLLGFLVFPVLILSIPGGKHLRYLLPLLPAPAIAGGYCIAELLPQWSKRAEEMLKYLRFLPLAELIAVPVIMIVCPFLYSFRILPWINWILAAALFFALWRIRNLFHGCAGAFAIITLCALVSYCGIIIPFFGTVENSSVFVRTVEQNRTGNLYLFNMDRDHETLKYILWMSPEEKKKAVCLKKRYVSRNSVLDRMYRQEDAMTRIRELQPGDILIVKHGRKTVDLEKLLQETRHTGKIEVSGNLGHRKYNAIRIEK